MFRLLLLATLLAAPWAAHAKRPKVEVAFVLDATGSMGPWIGEARQRIKGIAADLAQGDPAPEVRFALVRYRDTTDAFTTQVVPFTKHIDAMRAALDETSARGGGDTPEAVLEGLLSGIRDLKWREGDDVLRLLYLVGDAPPQTGSGRPFEQEVLSDALHRGIVIHTIACGHMSRGGQGFFERVARLSEGRAFRLADLRGRKAGEAAEVAGATRAGSLAEAVSGSARAYADSVGVDFDAAAGRVAIDTEPVPVDSPDPPTSGLLGAQARVVADLATWADLWRAHHSLSAEPPPPPKVDFTRHQVLVLGGEDAGLALASLTGDAKARVACLTPAAPGVRFVRVPAAEQPLFSTLTCEGGAR